MRKYYVYVMTNDLERRVIEHKQKLVPGRRVVFQPRPLRQFYTLELTGVGMKDSPFYFGDVTGLGDSDSFVAELPEEITTVDQLLEAYYKLLEFPAYFGFNWNALWECLCDLEWIRNHQVIIVHKALPRIEHSQIRIYLFQLTDCVREWEKNGTHVVIVAFPEKLEQVVNSLLESRSDCT